MDKTSWFVAVALFVLLIFRDVAKKWITAAIEGIGQAIFRRMASSRFMRSRALAKYRAAVLRRYSEAAVPFMDEKLPMRDVFVPLMAMPAESGAADTRSGQDADALIGAIMRAVVTGVPGAGKSMLLRHAMLSWATRNDPPMAVPALYDLHRHNGTQASIEDLIAQQFQDNGFPNAGRFIQRALAAGGMTVLLDGFDEVNTAERPRVAEMIKDFGARYPKARIIVTCRTAVYDRQLSPELNRRFAIFEFDERMIRRFLGNWPTLKDLGRVEHMMEALRNSPRVMQLARNPLLLTMIAYLYASGDGRRRLPHSRAQFYQEATDYLLRRLKDAYNRYDGRTKKAALQRLALACMDAGPATTDRMTLPYRTVLEVMAETLPEFNESPQDARAMLAEIVERSGLLLAVDGGDRYQFAHLTLQEFLAACELADHPAALLERYRGDPTRWRECVKLWCGVTSRDSTSLIKAAYDLEPALGLECLAEAHRFDDPLGWTIIGKLMSELDNPAVVKGFGVVAADPRPRGVAVYERLASLADAGDVGAIEALAETNTAKAGELVAELASRGVPAAQDALLRMGDLAVTTLAQRANQVWAVDGLAKIATPAAIEQLLPVMADDSRPTRHRAACHLAALLRRGDALEAMRSMPYRLATGKFSWFWEPFRTEDDGDLPGIVSDIAHRLIELVGKNQLPADLDDIDPRIAFPLCLTLCTGERPLPEMVPLPAHLYERLPDVQVEMRSYSTYFMMNGSRRYEESHKVILYRYTYLRTTESASLRYEKDAIEALRDAGLLFLKNRDSFTSLVHRLDPELGLELVRAWLRRPYMARQDWQAVRQGPTKRHTFNASLLFKAIVATVLVPYSSGAVLALGAATSWWDAWGPTWLGWTCLAMIVIGGYALANLATPLSDSERPMRYSTKRLVLNMLFGGKADRQDPLIWALVWALIGLAGAAGAAAAFLIMMNLQQYLGWWAVLGLFAAIGLGILAGAASTAASVRKERISQNPLRYVIALIDRSSAEPASIIH